MYIGGKRTKINANPFFVRHEVITFFVRCKVSREIREGLSHKRKERKKALNHQGERKSNCERVTMMKREKESALRRPGSFPQP